MASIVRLLGLLISPLTPRLIVVFKPLKLLAPLLLLESSLLAFIFNTETLLIFAELES